MNLKYTPLYDAHVALGAKMVNFEGWMMPIQYEGILKEHEYVRTGTGVFDISHMGEFILEAPNIVEILQKLMTNDLNLLEDSKGQYSCLCYENGTTVDDMIYYRENLNKFRFIVNAANIEKDINWIKDNINGDTAKITDVSENRCRLAFQGKNAARLLQPLVILNINTLKRFYCSFTKLNGIQIFLARTGYTGEDGFEMSFDKKYALDIWNELLKTGARPIGLGARDSLRLEACYSLYGHELSDKITPIEAGLSWVVKPKKNINFNGKKQLIIQKERGPSRTLVGLNLKHRGIIRANYKIFKNGKNIGYVTSGCFSPTLKKTIGLGLIKSEYKEIDTEIEIEIRGKLLKAVVVSTPFVRNI